MGAILEQALEPVAATLEADGYRLSAEVRGDVVVVEVAAGPDACADCLIPREVMAVVISDRLRAAGLPPAVALTYPTARQW